MFIQTFSLVVLLILVTSVIGAVVALAIWPGRIARARNHPYADAVSVAGWVGILAGGVFWPLALVWAYSTPVVLEKVPTQSPGDAVPQNDTGENES